MPKTIFFIPKMDCPTEEKLIRSKLRTISNIQLEFNLMQKELTIIHQNIDLSIIQKALSNIGMEAQVKNNSFTNQHLKMLQPGVMLQDWIIIGISGLLAIVAEIFAFTTRSEHSLAIIVLASASMLIGGRQTFLKGLRAIRHFTLNMNFLMTVAILGAVMIGEWPEAAMVTFLFALAETIEVYSLDKARHAISRLIEISPDDATVQTDEGNWQVKPISKIKLNDIVRVKPGERIPLDGVVFKGHSSVNQAPITGESIPLEKKPGDTVFAGSINERGSFEFKVTTQVNETLLAKIIRAVQKAQSERAPAQKFVDQFAKYYTPSMVVLAILVATLPTLIWGAAFYSWFYKALVLLVIACPCALVISTPVTIVSGLAAAAKQGILIKGGTYLEEGRKLKAIAFDKTGTLTEGKPRVTDIALTAELTENAVLQLAASLESHSEHPVAEAVLKHWERLTSQKLLLPISEFETIPGAGVVGKINNQYYFLGNHRFAEKQEACNSQIEALLKGFEQQGKTAVVLGSKQRTLAILAVADTVRENSLQTIQFLHKLGIKTIMITGDNPTTAQTIAKSLNIDDVQANLFPEDKLIAIDILLKKYRKVGMVGDGINDAPALAKASIGFAMGSGGTDVALETADIAIMEDNLKKVPFFIILSRRVWHKLIQNITLSIGIKAVFFILALMGMASLWMAIFADMGASLIVVFNGLRLLHFEE